MSNSHTRMWLVAIPATLIGLVLLGVATAGSVNTPNTFVPNTPALASDVNGNFQAHESAIDDNDARLTTLEEGTADGIVRAAASIAADGTVDRSFNLRGGAVTVSKSNTGIYFVTFGGFTDLDQRFYAVTVGGTNGGGERGSTGVAPLVVNPEDTLFIQTLDELGAQADLPFYVVVY